MRGLNRAQLIGNIGRDPEIKQTVKGLMVMFTMAVNEAGPDLPDPPDWDDPASVSWHRVVLTEHLARAYADAPEGTRAAEGDLVFVEGSIQHRPVRAHQGSHKVAELVVGSEGRFEVLARRRSGG